MPIIYIFKGVFQNIDIKRLFSHIDMNFTELPLRALRNELMLYEIDMTKKYKKG